MADALPSHLLMYLFEFLAYEDYKCLVFTCKRYSQAVLKHNKLWARECLKKYLSFDLELYSNIYDSEDYKSYILQKLLYLKENSWRQILEEGEMCRRSMNVVLAQLAGKEDAESFMEYFDETLKQPNLPLTKLKRETVNCNTETLFQTKLSEVLYEDNDLSPKKSSFFDNQFLTQLNNLEKSLFSEMAQYDRNEILRARWYNFEKKETSSDNDETISFEERNDFLYFDSPNVGDLTKISNASTDDLQMLKQKPAFLMSLYENLLYVLTHHCQVIHRFVSSIDDIYLIIAEYSARWKAYVCVMLELEKSFAPFVKLMNKHYEALFEGYPSFPKFSIWRLMTKIWIQEVYEKSNLSQNLNESFLKILNCHRETNVKEIFNNNSIQNEELPKSLFIDLSLKEQQGIMESLNQRNFWDDLDLGKDLLSSYVQSVQDISFNEVNIHYSECSDMSINYPYCELEKAILHQSDRFYGEYQQVFSEVPEFFCRFLKCDSSMLSEILGERTSIKLLQVQTQKEFQTMEIFIDNKLNEIDEQQFKNVENQIILSNEIDETTGFIHDFVREFLEKKNSCQNQEMKIEKSFEKDTGIMEEEIISHEPKASISQTSLRALVAIIEASASHFRSNFECIKEQMEILKNVTKRDKYIRQENGEKNIPCELGDIDCLFYDLDKNLNLRLLEKLYEDYIIHTKQQERGKNNDLSPSSYPTDELSLGNGFEFDQDFFEDVENFDFMMIREPALQRDMV